MKAILLFIFAALIAGAVYLIVPKQYDFDGSLDGQPPTNRYRCAGFTYIGSANLSCIDCGYALYCQGVILPRKQSTTNALPAGDGGQ